VSGVNDGITPELVQYLWRVSDMKSLGSIVVGDYYEQFDS